jgi:hypothetical protein
MGMGRIAVLGIVVVTLVAGVALWWLQLHGFYQRLPVQASVPLTPVGAVAPVAVAVADFEGIDSDSSPIRYRACFRLEGTAQPFAPYPDATPLNAPGWFSCFDAGAIGAALAEGRAQAVLSEANVRFGIDRVAVLFADGRGYAWTQINRCGEAHFDGRPLPPGCPPPPVRP